MNIKIGYKYNKAKVQKSWLGKFERDYFIDLCKPPVKRKHSIFYSVIFIISIS